LVRVLAGEIDEGFLVAALGNGNFDFVACALGKQGGQRRAVVEVDRHEDGARHVLLVDVELLEEGGEDRAGMECGHIRFFKSNRRSFDSLRPPRRTLVAQDDDSNN
jgi:hypothetical protein